MPPSERKKLDAALGRQRQIATKAPRIADKKTKQEAQNLENQKKRTEITSDEQDIGERKRYAALFFVLSCWWMVTITGVVLVDGWRTHGFWLPDKIVLALIGSTTVNVLGILYVVAHYLFPKR